MPGRARFPPSGHSICVAGPRRPALCFAIPFQSCRDRTDDGLLEAAGPVLEPTAISADRRYCLAHYLRADLGVQASVERNHIAEIEALIREAGLPASGEVLLRLALAKELEDIGASMDEPSTRSRLPARCNDARSPMTAARNAITSIRSSAFRRANGSPPARWRPAPPITSWSACLARGRRWSNKLYEPLRARVGPGKAGPSGSNCTAQRKPLPTIRISPPSAGAMSTPSRHSGCRRDRRIVDKTLQNYLYCGIILRRIAAGKNHPGQAASVGCRLGHAKGRFQGKFLFPTIRPNLQTTSWLIAASPRHWKATLPPHAFMEVDYEDIVRDQAEQSRRPTRRNHGRRASEARCRRDQTAEPS